jgi:hypothetical protein
MIISDVMDEIGGRLDEIDGLVTAPFAATSVAIVPAALISLPATGTYDLTYGRGMDAVTLEIFVLVSTNVDLAARNALSPFISGSGTKSIRAKLASKGWQSCDAVRVTGFTSARIKLAANTYLAAVFSADVTGKGGL